MAFELFDRIRLKLKKAVNEFKYELKEPAELDREDVINELGNLLGSSFKDSADVAGWFPEKITLKRFEIDKTKEPDLFKMELEIDYPEKPFEAFSNLFKINTFSFYIETTDKKIGTLKEDTEDEKENQVINVEDNIDKNIQPTLEQFSNENVVNHIIASDLKSMISRRDIVGIYLEDHKVSKKLAKDLGKKWNQLIPQDQKVAFVNDPQSQVPVVVLKKDILSDSTKVDDTFMNSWTLAFEKLGEEKMSTSTFSSFQIKENPNQQFQDTPETLRALAAFINQSMLSHPNHPHLKFFIKHALERVLIFYYKQTYDSSKISVLQQIEEIILMVHPIIGKEAIKEVVETKIENQSEFRKTIFRKADELFAKAKANRIKNSKAKQTKSNSTNSNQLPCFRKDKKCRNLPKCSKSYVYGIKLNAHNWIDRGLIEHDGIFDYAVIDRCSLAGKSGSYTTCVDWQPKLLNIIAADKNLNYTMKYKYPLFYGEAEKRGKSINGWHAGQENMPKTYRPKPGDIYVTKLKKNGGLSHVGYIKSIKVISEEEEIWTAMDGGQTRNGLQAVTEPLRIYNPKTNIIKAKGAVTSQDGKPRWLFGWIKVDKVLK